MLNFRVSSSRLSSGGLSYPNPSIGPYAGYLLLVPVVGKKNSGVLPSDLKRYRM
ncbi:MAG: hypothetical protein V4714_09545 [Bacteroidota bacterium]